MTTPRRLIKELTEKAVAQRLFGDNELILRKCHAEGTEIPDRLLPGRFIMRLPEDQRKILQDLKSDDIKDLLAGEVLISWREKV